MKTPNGEEIFRIEGNLVINRPEFAATFFYKVSPLTIVMAGEYKIYLGLDEEPEEIASLKVLQEELPQLGLPTA
jgi:hypothetical protein